MNIEYIEYVLIAIVIVFQLWFFIRTRRKITEFKNSIPDISQVIIADVELTDDQIEAYVSNKLMGGIETYNNIVSPTNLFERDTQNLKLGLNGENSGGLGMNIIKTIVELHNGEIWFESEKGKGSIFYIELPKN
ncbi:MAG: ATP-binding protein [Pedobacter sp.]|nr:MAG: ATP-binding protein [Pedobacter sp.]